MNTKISTIIRKTLYGIMLLSILLSALGINSTHTAHAQEMTTEILTESGLWQEYRDPRYGYGLAVPVDWTVSPTPPEGYPAAATFMNFNASSTGDESWPANGIKFDLQVSLTSPDISLRDWPAQYISEAAWDNEIQKALLSVDSLEEITIGSHSAIKVQFHNTTDDMSTYSIIAIQLSPEKVLTVYVTPNDVALPPVIQMILESLVPSIDETIQLPDKTPPPQEDILPPNGYEGDNVIAHVIHECSWGSEVGSSPITLQIPFSPGTTWTVGGYGSFYGDGYHTGNDYYATDWNMGTYPNNVEDLGQSVYPVAAGTAYYGYDTGYGNYVDVYHTGNQVRTRYAHLRAISIQNGASVSISTKIGEVGSTGNSTGNHLHLSFWFNVNGQWNSTYGQGRKPSPMQTASGTWELCDSQSRVVSNKTVICNNPSPNSDQVGLYGDDSYCGAYKILGVADYSNPSALGVANDSISSIKVGGNVRATLCKDDNYGGGCEDFTSDDPSLSNNSIGNDSVSSARVVKIGTPLPSDYGFCAEEGARCSFSGTATIYYGASNQFLGPRTFTDGLDCNNNTFGSDPIPGTHKQCFIKGGRPEGSTWCSDENGTCSFGSGNIATVYYGANGKYNTKTGVASSVACNNSTFGDPFSGIGKACYYKVTGTNISTPSNPNPADNTTFARTNNTVLSWSTNGTSCSTHIWGGSIDISPSNNCGSLTLGNQRGGAYNWQVAASNGSSSATGPVWHFNIKPYGPTNLGISSSAATQVTLNWTLSSDEPTDIDKYDIYQNDVYKTSVPKGTSTSTVSGLACDGSYSFYVKSNRQGVLSDASNTVNRGQVGCQPAKPSLSSPANGTTLANPQNVTFNWSSTGDSYSLVITGGPSAQTVTPTTNSYNAGSMWAGVYQWYVKSYRNGLWSDPSDTWTLNMTPGAPGSVSVATNSTSAVTVSWTDSPGGVDGYRIYRNGAQVGTVASGILSYQVTGLACGDTSTYSVRGYKGSLESPDGSASGSTTNCPGNQTLTVGKSGTGSGTVTSSPAGINCGSTCSATFNYNAPVTLTATSTNGSTFTGWSYAGCPGSGTCTVTMNAAVSVTASFADTTPPSISWTSPVSSQRVFDVGDQAILLEVAATDNIGVTVVTFYRWDYLNLVNIEVGKAYGPPYSIIFDAGTLLPDWNEVIAEASDAAGNSAREYIWLNHSAPSLLTVSKAGSGSGTVTSSPAGINCGSTCSYNFPYNTIVTLTATPISTSIFAGWSIPSCSGNTCSVTMDAAKSVTANFAPSAAFNKISPANAATNQKTSVALSWGKSAGATAYWYCYDTTNDNACSNWVNNGTAIKKNLSGLARNTTYYWHVRAVSGLGTTYSNGSATAFWSFKTK